LGILLLLPVGAMLVITTARTHATQAAAAPKAPETRVVTCNEMTGPFYREWIGTVDGLVNAEIRAQGFRYQADLDQAERRSAQSQGQLRARAHAKGQVAVAKANQYRAQLDVDRYTPLFEQHAFKQDLDNSTLNNMGAKAQLKAARTEVETDKAQVTAAKAAVQAATVAIESARINSRIHAARLIGQTTLESIRFS
jgi:membrane fusion protein (multidrug efflux system)